MAKPTVQKQLFVPGYGSDYSHCTAVMKLVASVDGVDAFGYASDVDVVSAHRVSASETGLFSWVNVRPNTGVSADVITAPSGTVYEIQVYIPGRGMTKPEYISVPDSVGPVWVQDCLTVSPIDLPEVGTVPSGGSAGQFLTKDTNSDYDYSWTSVSPGSGAPVDKTYVTISNETSSLPNSVPYSQAPYPITSVATTYTVGSGDYIIKANAVTAGFTVTLLTAVGRSGVGRVVKKVDTSSNVVTVACTGGQTIDGSATYSITQPYESILFVSDGSNWMVI